MHSCLFLTEKFVFFLFYFIMILEYCNGTWYKGRMKNGLRHGYGVYKVPYDEITLWGLWKKDRFQFGIACHGHQSRFGFGDELYKGELLNRTSRLAVYHKKRKSKNKFFMRNRYSLRNKSLITK